MFDQNKFTDNTEIIFLLEFPFCGSVVCTLQTSHLSKTLIGADVENLHHFCQTWGKGDGWMA